jgi:hypothetical protein
MISSLLEKLWQVSSKEEDYGRFFQNILLWGQKTYL